MSQQHDTLWTNVNVFTASEAGIIESAAIGVKNGAISWIGPMPRDRDERLDAAEVIDAGARWMLPGLVDCHTHLVFGGQRAGEFEARLAGASYEEIARAGGGIASTVRSTREASEETLFLCAARRLRQLVRDGVTTVEIKSGYGLTTAAEEKMLRVARRLGDEFPVRVVTTFLGAHALPPEYADDRKGYLRLVCEDMLPTLAGQGLVDAVDGFCEHIAFTPEEMEQVFDAARRLGLPVKLHAEQLSDSGGAALAARHGALSADHLEYLSEDGVRQMAASGTVAVLLPGAFYTLRDTRIPPVDLLREHGVPMAVSTDANPGSSPSLSLRLMANMACQLFSLTVEEALHGVTINAARALGLDAGIGSIEKGKRADFVLLDIDEPAEFAYWLGGNIVSEVVSGGERIDLASL